MIYLDTAALVKLLRREPESDDLGDWLDAIHLATAQVVLGPRLTSFVTYDRRLLAAARDLYARYSETGFKARWPSLDKRETGGGEQRLVW